MEDFFKDLYFDFQESPDDESFRRAYTDLVQLYVWVLRETTNWLCDDNRVGAPVGHLLAAAGDAADDVTVITFNHDLVIENEIFRRARLASRWCLDHGYLKLHGSLNWRVRLAGARPTARTLTGESGSRDVQLLTPRHAPANPVYSRGRARGRGGRTQWPLWPVVIPPIYAKQALRRSVRLVWADAQRALEVADFVLFFGYSLPAIDIDAEKLFERALAQNGSVEWLDVVNPDPASAQRYAGLAPALPVHWYPSMRTLMGRGSPFS